MKPLATAGSFAAALAVAGCTSNRHQSSLDPAGVQANRIHDVWTLYLSVTLTVYLIVMAVFLYAMFRRRPVAPTPGADGPDLTPPETETRKAKIVAGAVGLTTVILFVFLIADFVAGQQINSQAQEQELTVRVTGRQWFWDARYDDPDPSKIVSTANEIHVPVGRTVHFELQSGDVIHSFWVPNLHGKTDMIPGHTTHSYIRADHEDTYWGQCAEFCGLQHANMRFLVVAQKEEDFNQWLDAQRQPAHEPTTESEKKGQRVFLRGTCVMCHTVSGTPAQSHVGPDLSHVARRQRIAAGTLPNQRGYLAGWVTDPHGTKPGVRMPANPLSPEELQSLLDYLESLK